MNVRGSPSIWNAPSAAIPRGELGASARCDLVLVLADGLERAGGRGHAEADRVVARGNRSAFDPAGARAGDRHRESRVSTCGYAPGRVGDVGGDVFLADPLQPST